MSAIKKLAEEYRHLCPVEICEGVCEIREGYGYYVVGRKHEWAKRKYKRYPMIRLGKIVDEEYKYYNKCKYGF